MQTFGMSFARVAERRTHEPQQFEARMRNASPRSMLAVLPSGQFRDDPPAPWLSLVAL